MIPAGKPITKVWVPIVIAASTAPNYNGFAVYDDAGNLLQQTPSDPSAFTATGWNGILLNAPIPAEDEDRFVYVGCLTSSNAQAIYTHGPNAIPGLYNGIGAKRRTWVNNALGGAFPSTINPVTDGQLFTYIMLVALS